MSKLLNSEHIDNTVLKNLEAQRKAIVDSWKKSGLLEGINAEIKPNIAQLLESEASYLINEVTEGSDEANSFYEDKYYSNLHKGNFRKAAYYSRKLIYSLGEMIKNKHCE